MKASIFIFFWMISFSGQASLSQRYFAFVIDGSGSMLYRTVEGKKRDAFKDKTKETTGFAQACTQTCVVDLVFLSHSARGKKVKLIRYQNGVSEKAVKKTLQVSQLAEAVRLWNKPLAVKPLLSVFSYFGHRPDLFTDHSSYLSHDHIVSFYRSLRKNGRFDISILSTCNGATPSFVSGFADSRFIVAAATPIHISMFPVKTYGVFLGDQATSLEQQAYQFTSTLFQEMRRSTYTQLALTLFAGQTLNIAELLKRHPQWDEQFVRVTDFQDCDTDHIQGIIHTFYQPAKFSYETRSTHTGMACPTR